MRDREHLPVMVVRVPAARAPAGLDPQQVNATDRYGDLLGASAVMQELFAKLVRLQGANVNLLISGDSGTGKELVARAVHEHSSVRNGPFIAVNCGALDRQLARSDLFGHQRGAFTGAIRSQPGAFEAAEGGTLFLDEIAELPADVQPVLLRALELKKIAPVGCSQERPVNVRLVTATNRDLAAEVRAGKFREDLYYRIHVVEISMPPLRKRIEDIPLLAREFAAQLGTPAPTADVLEALSLRHWPGNVRELRNAVEAYAALGVMPVSCAPAREAIDDPFAGILDATKTFADQKDELVQRFTRAYLERLLQQTSGNQSEAARVSGLERSYLGKLIDKLGLRAGLRRQNPEPSSA